MVACVIVCALCVHDWWFVLFVCVGCCACLFGVLLLCSCSCVFAVAVGLIVCLAVRACTCVFGRVCARAIDSLSVC